MYYVKQAAEGAIQRFDNINNGYSTPYISAPPPGMVARIEALSSGATGFLNYLYTRDIFFFEKQWVPCGCFETSSTDYLRRLNLGESPADTIYFRPSTTSWHAANMLGTEQHLFWKDVAAINPANHGAILRAPMNADALPSINIRVTGWQINQGVQRPANDIFLIRNRVTYFRLFVKSDGVNVDQVTARLTAYWGNAPQGSIAPITPLMTVKKYYSDIYQTNGFLFVLPREWLLHNDLQLEPVLNPMGVPLEPNYNDNKFSTTITPPVIYDNPQAKFHIVRLSYNYQNVNYTANDFNAIVSWLYRAYPIAVEPGGSAAGEQVITNNDVGKRVKELTRLKNVNISTTPRKSRTTATCAPATS